jgi:hypothetical protein
MLVPKAENKVFEIPDEGTYLAVLADIHDLGNVDTAYGKKWKALFVWELEEKDSEGHPFRIFKRFTVSIHPKAALYAAIRKITGVAPGEEADYELEPLIGRNNMLVVEHQEAQDGSGKKYARLSNILKAPTKGSKLTVSKDFVRARDKKESPTKPTGTANAMKPVRAQLPNRKAWEDAEADAAAAKEAENEANEAAVAGEQLSTM